MAMNYAHYSISSFAKRIASIPRMCLYDIFQHFYLFGWHLGFLLYNVLNTTANILIPNYIEKF